jgi:hypothetical protein
MEISFLPSSKVVEEIVSPPKPAIDLIPQWYKNLSNTNRDDLKKCMPFYDAMISGYIQESWSDIEIKIKNNEPTINQNIHPRVVGIRDKKIKINSFLYQKEFVWIIPWVPVMPEGYSMLITTPANRLDLPFVCMSGIIDFDTFYHMPYGNAPFLVYSGFQGVIPKGTPMFQMIPVKREDWAAYIQKHDNPKNIRYIMKKIFFNKYRTHFWTPKKYK